MAAMVVLGAQWGDEGKGKLTDILVGSNVTLCCRAAGGNNAGHTIVANDIKYDFHILPSGLIVPHCRNLIGSGCVVHIKSFFAELRALKEKGLSTEGRIFISSRSHVVFDLHQRVDGLEEQELGKQKVGTTGKGIGPCYSTKGARSGIRIGELVNDKEDTDRRLRNMARGFQKRYGDLLKYDVEEEIQQCDAYREQVRPFVVDAVDMVVEAQDKGEKMLVEGANALLLDIDYGTYPYVTSSGTGLAGVFSGLGGLRRKYIENVVGVVKAYSTRVGSGPFPTECLNADGTENETGRKLQEIGKEFGVTTGRRRRTGWLDGVALRFSCAINQYDALNISKLDILDTFPEIKCATAYHLVDHAGKRVETLPSFPADLGLLTGTSSRGRIEVEYKSFAGWQTSIEGITKWEDLPQKAKEYVEWIEAWCKTPVKYIGTGVKREDIIVR